MQKAICQFLAKIIPSTEASEMICSDQTVDFRVIFEFLWPQKTQIIKLRLNFQFFSPKESQKQFGRDQSVEFEPNLHLFHPRSLKNGLQKAN